MVLTALLLREWLRTDLKPLRWQTGEGCKHPPNNLKRFLLQGITWSILQLCWPYHLHQSQDFLEVWCWVAWPCSAALAITMPWQVHCHFIYLDLYRNISRNSIVMQFLCVTSKGASFITWCDITLHRSVTAYKCYMLKISSVATYSLAHFKLHHIDSLII